MWTKAGLQEFRRHKLLILQQQKSTAQKCAHMNNPLPFPVFTLLNCRGSITFDFVLVAHKVTLLSLSLSPVGSQ